MGPPGSGKGTQAFLISQALGIPHISTGDIFRKVIGKGDGEGDLLKSLINEGQLIPDELTAKIVFARLNEKDCQKGFILDGFPRTINQAEKLDDYVKENKLKIDFIIALDVSAESIANRVKKRKLCKGCGASYNEESNPPKVTGICDYCGLKLSTRDDDKEETVKDRIKVYEAKTKPLIDYYEKQGNLCFVDGEKSVEATTELISKCLGKDI